MGLDGVEIRHFGRLRATIYHQRRAVVLSLDRVKKPLFNPDKLTAWARQTLAGLEGYAWDDSMGNNSYTVK